MAKMTLSEILEHFERHRSEENRQGKARFGIDVSHCYGLGNQDLRELAKKIGRNHELALALWDSGSNEARILACYLEEKRKITLEQMDRWAHEAASWDVCDTAASLFAKTGLHHPSILRWTKEPEEFVKRMGYVLIACVAVHQKKLDDSAFDPYFQLIEEAVLDRRNFVKKAVNWALRQIGKRNLALHAKALTLAEELAKSEDPTARWIGKDAIRDITKEKTLKRLQDKAEP